MRATVATVVVSLVSGCSFFLVPRVEPGAPCKEDSVAPAIDFAGTLAFGIPGGVIVWTGATDGDHEGAPPASWVVGFGVLVLIPATVYVISGVRGLVRESRCRDLHARAR